MTKCMNEWMDGLVLSFKKRSTRERKKLYLSFDKNRSESSGLTLITSHIQTNGPKWAA